MPDSEKKPSHRFEMGAGEGPVFNRAECCLAAIALVRDCLGSFEPGAIWNHRAPRGEFEVKGAFNLKDEPVAVLHFNPLDGSVLPRGVHALVEGTPEAHALIRSKMNDLVAGLSVLEGAEFREPESCWAVPLAQGGRIVAHVKVQGDGSRIIGDKRAMEEIAGACSELKKSGER